VAVDLMALSGDERVIGGCSVDPCPG